MRTVTKLFLAGTQSLDCRTLTNMFSRYEFNGHSYASPDDAIKQQSLIRVKLQHIEMLDDNHLPSNTTSCVLKAMGALVVPTKQN